jgi:hypothetical protein
MSKTTIDTQCPPKVVVFDLDETLGYFCQIGTFLDCISSCSRIRSTASRMYDTRNFFTILRLYPEIIRPKIFAVLKLLKEKKELGILHKVLVYTNNNGGRKWVDALVAYYNYKMKSTVIDNVIHAFKINGEVVEPRRTTHDKTMGDFLNCTQLPRNIEVCFIDDLHHPQMFHDNVLYIRIKPYVHVIPWNIIVDRFFSSTQVTRNILSLTTSDISYSIREINTLLDKCDITEEVKEKEDLEIDKIITKRVYNVLAEFLDASR